MEYISIDAIKPHKDNPRKISLKNLDKLCESLKNNKEYFEARPIICDKNYIIFAGNSRYKAAKRIGLKEVPVHIIDLPEHKMREIMIRDNVSSGTWNEAILADDWDIGALVDFGIEIKGYTFAKEEENREGEINEQKKKKNKTRKIMTCPHCEKEFEI